MIARVTRIMASLRGLVGRRRIDGEILEELRDHLEREIEAHRRRGIPLEEARRLALRDLGGLAQTVESTRDVRSTSLDAIWRDLKFGARLLRRSPRFTLTALTVLVLGIGSTTAIFSVAYAVLLRPLPYPDAERLVFVAEHKGSGIAWPNYDDWRRRAASFDGLAGSLADAVIVTGGQLPRRLDSRSVTANFFGVLGTTPVQGRLFAGSDARPDAASTAVLSYACALREFGSAPAATGRTVSLNRQTYSVIGVLPPGFRYMTAADVYLLLEPQVAANYRGMQSRGNHTTFFAVGRLKPGVPVTSARAEMQNISAALALEHPETNKGGGVYVVPLADRVVRDMAPTLTVLAGAVALLLLIASVNFASLLLNRSASRAHEFGLRAAIGGTRWRLIRQLLVEHALLVAAGGVLGALAGAAILSGLVSLAPPDTPRLDEIRLDLAVLASTTLFSCACAFVFGVLPALKAGALGQQTVPRSGRGSTRQNTLLRRSLLVGEVAVATVPALRIRIDGPHDGPALARRSGLRSAQPADRHVHARRARLAGSEEAGVLYRSGRTASSCTRRGERRDHLLTAHSGIELVELVHGCRQASTAGRRDDGSAERGNGASECELFRHLENPGLQRAFVQPLRHP